MPNPTLQQFITLVREKSTDKNFYFVRTDSGSNFDAFLNHNFIGVGWNYVTPEDIQVIENNPAARNTLKAKIANNHERELDLDTRRGRQESTGIINKIRKFSEIRRGDIVIIPAPSSSRLAFGIIEDDRIYIDTAETEGRTYHKRRRVRWITVKAFSDLDFAFNKICSPRHAIFNVNTYSYYIRKVIDTLYATGDSFCYVLKIERNGDINVDELMELMSNFKALLNAINTQMGWEEDVPLSVKINLQSPGDIVLKYVAPLALATLVLMNTGCAINERNTSPEVLQFEEAHRELIDSVSASMRTIDTSRTRVVNPFNY